MMIACNVCAVGMAPESLGLLKTVGSTLKFYFQLFLGLPPVASEVNASLPYHENLELINHDTGPNEDQMFVTTAHCGAINGDASRQTRFPDSGHLFVVNLAGKYKGGKWRYPFTG
jgi:hypothetical protein